MEKRCGNCRHWGGHNPDEDHKYYKHQPCKRIKHDKDFDAKPYNIDDIYDEEERKAAQERIDSVKDAAVVHDGSGYFAALKTRNDFGCSLWKENNET